MLTYPRSLQAEGLRSWCWKYDLGIRCGPNTSLPSSRSISGWPGPCHWQKEDIPIAALPSALKRWGSRWKRGCYWSARGWCHLQMLLLDVWRFWNMKDMLLGILWCEYLAHEAGCSLCWARCRALLCYIGALLESEQKEWKWRIQEIHCELFVYRNSSLE